MATLLNILHCMHGEALTIHPWAQEYILHLLFPVYQKLSTIDCERVEELAFILPGELASHAHYQVVNVQTGQAITKVIEYIAAEILELAGKALISINNRNKKSMPVDPTTEIGCFHVNYAIAQDTELSELLKDLLPPPCLCIPPARIVKNIPPLYAVREALESKLGSVSELVVRFTWNMVYTLLTKYTDDSTMLRCLFDDIEIRTTRAGLNATCLAKVAGLIIDGIKNQDEKLPPIVQYEHLVGAIMHNKIFDLTPYLRP